jgi:ABC-2 type transporter
LSIAVEMISSPSLIFLDEPTSGELAVLPHALLFATAYLPNTVLGLDSSAAASLVENLRNLANDGKTVVAVIHQPSQHVFSMFDDLLLLSDGQQMYFGPVKDVRSYMEKQGYQPEKEVGTAEYVIECISRVPRAGESDADAHKRILALADNAKTTQKVDLGTVDESGHKMEHYAVVAARHGPRANIFKQFRLLMKRAFKEAFRGKGILILKTVQQVTVALIYGGIYKLGNNQVGAYFVMAGCFVL